MKSLLVCLSLAGGLTLAGSAAVEGQVEADEMVTDSVTGTLVERLPNGFVLRTDEGEDMVLELASDTIQELQEEESDTTAGTAPHSGMMDPRDVLFILDQLEESEEQDRMSVHYVTLADPGRRVVVWMSIAADRVPGGGVPSRPTHADSSRVTSSASSMSTATSSPAGSGRSMDTP